MSKTIRVKLYPDGKRVVIAEGYKGKSCLEATKFLEKVLGAPDEQDLKASYHEEDEVIVKNGLPEGYCG